MQVILNNDEITEIVSCMHYMKDLHETGEIVLTQSSRLTINDIINKLSVETPNVTEF